MGVLSSGIGLVSGLPIQQIVDGLIASRARPITLLGNRIQQAHSVRTAYLDLSARVLALKAAAARLKSADVFRATVATSSQPSVLGASATAGAAPGAYVFTVRSLAAAQQFVSGGYARLDAPLFAPGTITVEAAAARLDASTSLAALNGGTGVRTGRIRIVDRAGSAAVIDLTSARTVGDVVAAINGQTAAAVTARVSGDRIVLEDRSGASSGNLIVEDVGGGFAGLDLGIRGVSATSQLTGEDIIRLSATLGVDLLNDGNGLRVHGVSDDLRISLADGTTIDVNLSGRLQSDTPLLALNGGAGVPAGRILLTNRAGLSAEVDLTGAATIGDVVAAINSAGAGLTATLVGSHFLITDASGGNGVLSVAEVNGGTTATALGLTTAASGAALSGRDIHRIATLGDVLRAINLDPQNGGTLTAEIAPDGDRIRLVDHTSGGGSLAVTSLNGSRAAADLGLSGATSGAILTSGRLLAGMDTVLLRSLNGGAGVTPGIVRLIDRSGAAADVDLTNASTLDDVMAAINAAGIGMTARLTGSGLGVEIVDSSGGTGNLRISDLSGGVAAGLDIAVDAAVSSVRNANLQRRYVSESTRLDALPGPFRFVRGRFRITDSTGASAVVDLTQGDEQTLGDVIAEINSRGIGVTASINANGDGLLLTDTAAGAGALRVSEEGGGTARSLGILGSAAGGQTSINGSFERTIAVGAADTLTTLAERIRASGAAVTAAVINDGSAAPYRLSLSATQSGRAGQLAIDTGDTGLSLTRIVEGRDAAVVFGPADATHPLVLFGSTNTLSGSIPGVTLDLLAASEQPVTVQLSRSSESAVSAMKAFVDGYNAVVQRIAELSRFDAATGSRGPLFGDATTRSLESRLTSLVTRTLPGAPRGFDRLSAIGVGFGSGGQLSFDESRFRAALDADPQAVENLFTLTTSGLGVVFEEQLGRMADSGGLLASAGEVLERTVSGLTERQKQLQAALDRQRAMLTAKFQAAERALSQLQAQQSALAAFSTNMAALLASRGGSTGGT